MIIRRSRFNWIVCGVLFVVAGLIVVGFWMWPRPSAGQKQLAILAQQVSFPVYYPATLPSYFFIDGGQVVVSGNTLIFTITRNDGQKVMVTEQLLPSKFKLSQVTGTAVMVPSAGRAVIGTGFQGYRAVITATSTLIFISATQNITSADFAVIVKSFRPL